MLPCRGGHSRSPGWAEVPGEAWSQREVYLPATGQAMAAEQRRPDLCMKSRWATGAGGRRATTLGISMVACRGRAGCRLVQVRRSELAACACAGWRFMGVRSILEETRPRPAESVRWGTRDTSALHHSRASECYELRCGGHMFNRAARIPPIAAFPAGALCTWGQLLDSAASPQAASVFLYRSFPKLLGSTPFHSFRRAIRSTLSMKTGVTVGWLIVRRQTWSRCST